MERSKRTIGREAYADRSGKISWPVRLAYAGGDVACNVVFGMIGTLLTMFYTDYALITAGTIGIIMLVSRIFDGFSDVIMGIIVEKTHSRFGKARPWLLWMSIPFCLSAVLLFTVPGVGVKGDPWYKVLYVFITYNFCTTVCYTAINLPYGTLSTLMTDKSYQRDMLGNVRMGLSPLGKIIAVVATLPLVKLMGNNQMAWAKTMSIWATVAFILLLMNFLFCKETIGVDKKNAIPSKNRAIEKINAIKTNVRVNDEKIDYKIRKIYLKNQYKDQLFNIKWFSKNQSRDYIKEKKTQALESYKEKLKVLHAKHFNKVNDIKGLKNKLPMGRALKFLVKNKYFWLVLLLWMFQSVSFGVVGTILPYFCKWVIHDENLYSTLFLVETLTLVAGVFACMPLVKKVGKRNLALIGSVIALAGQVAYIFNAKSVGMIYMSCVVRSIGLAPLNAVVFGMLGDVVDYGHWKNGVRQESFICAGGSVGTKLGSGLSSVLITQLLQLAGYDGSRELAEGQSEKALTMITNLYIIGPIVIAAGVLLVLIFYQLDKHYDEMMDELWDTVGGEALLKHKLKEKAEKEKKGR